MAPEHLAAFTLPEEARALRCRTFSLSLGINTRDPNGHGFSFEMEPLVSRHGRNP